MLPDIVYRWNREHLDVDMFFRKDLTVPIGEKARLIAGATILPNERIPNVEVRQFCHENDIAIAIHYPWIDGSSVWLCDPTEAQIIALCLRFDIPLGNSLSHIGKTAKEAE